MAIKEKKEGKSSKIRTILTTEYKWETYLIGVLSCVALALGLLMVTNVLTIKDTVPIIGTYPKVFQWIILGLGLIGLVLFAIPFFRPAVPEIKKLEFPTFRVFIANTTRVFIFIIVLTLLFLLYEAFITALLGRVM